MLIKKKKNRRKIKIEKEYSGNSEKLKNCGLLSHKEKDQFTHNQGLNQWIPLAILLKEPQTQAVGSVLFIVPYEYMQAWLHKISHHPLSCLTDGSLSANRWHRHPTTVVTTDFSQLPSVTLTNIAETLSGILCSINSQGYNCFPGGRAAGIDHISGKPRPVSPTRFLKHTQNTGLISGILAQFAEVFLAFLLFLIVVGRDFFLLSFS